MPETLSQPMAALERANEKRIEKARVKRELKTGIRSVTETLVDPPSCLLNAEIAEVVDAIPKVGRLRAIRLLRKAEILNPTTRVRDLSRPTRRRIAQLIQQNYGWK
jgi:hypothetical protein